jgi:predicted acylesterase/phospholipase RssA
MAAKGGGGTQERPRGEKVTLEQLLGANPAIALSGGGTHGDFEVGVVRYLYDHGVRPKILSGTSVGAINALKLAEGETGGKGSKAPGHVPGLAGLEAIWHSLKSDADMWKPDPQLDAIWKAIDEIIKAGPELEAALDGLMGDKDLLVGGFITSVLFPASPFQVLQGYGLAKTASEADTIIDTLEKAFKTDDLKRAFLDTVRKLESAVALTNLNPIYATMKKPSSFQKDLLQTSGIKLRLAMVALEDGQLRYVNEDGILLERDGTPTPTPKIPDPKCADPIHKKLDPLLEQLAAVDEKILKPTLDSKGKPEVGGAELYKLKNDKKDLLAKIAPLQKVLAACPKVEGPPVKVDPVFAALASSSIPVVFPPQQIGAQHYVDGGIRTITPIEAAIGAGASMVFAVAASSPEIEYQAFGQSWELLTIALRVSETIMIDEIARRDLFPPVGFGLPVLLIRPEVDIHTSMTIEPGLVSIRMAHGFMRADDVVQAYLVSISSSQITQVAVGPYRYLREADQNSARRNTMEIVNLRYQIWQKEYAANGKQFVDVNSFPPRNSFVKNLGTNATTYAEIRQMKKQLKALVEERIKKGGECPAGYEEWWNDWEDHSWTPPAFKQMKVKMTPATLKWTVEASKFQVHATDVNDGKTIAGASVLIDGVKKGVTDEEITFHFKKDVKIDPITHDHEANIPRITVAKSGYQDAEVVPIFTG